MPTDEPIGLIHWGAPNVEDEEIGEIRLLLEATLFSGSQLQVAKAPKIAELRVTEASINKLRERLFGFLRLQSNLQVLYFSAHGNTGGFSFNRSGNPTIAYCDFADLLSDSLRSDDCVHVVLGSCEAMELSVAIEQLMPRAVCVVSGFTACPVSTDVAGLMASIVQDDVVLFDSLSSENRSICGIGDPVEKIREVVDKWRGVLSKHNENPKREVRGRSGVAIVTATRNETTGKWNRRIIPLD